MAPNTGATSIAPVSKFARFVSGWDIVLTTALHRTASHARHAALRTRHQGTRTRRSAVRAEVITPPQTRAVPPASDLPFNKERVRKELQQEQQQRDALHHRTHSSSSQGELQAAGSTPGRKSKSRSRSRRRSRSKARYRTHFRTGTQPPPVKRATTSEAAAPLAKNQSSLTSQTRINVPEPSSAQRT
ncbi:hypothetical protein MTO96_030657 [Rhipicephalus appendiculatus]